MTSSKSKGGVHSTDVKGRNHDDRLIGPGLDDGSRRRVRFADRPRTAGSRVVDYVVDHLTAAGVGHVFGVDGANIEDLYDAAFFCPDVTAVLAKHEFSAATMADGYSRATASLGVVAATSGGGALNLVAGLGESYASRVPVLALVGQSPTTLDGRGAFQDTSGRNGSLNAEALFSAVSVYCRRIVDPDHILTALPEAVAAARDGGPAVLLLPKDVQQATVHTNGASTVNGQRHCPEDPYPILRALHDASGPVTIIAGEQVARDDARDELERLRAALHAWVATVPDAKDVSQSALRASASLGVTGVMGHPGVADAIRSGAVCLLIGTRLPVTARAGLDAALRETCTLSIGSAPPYLPSIHVHTNDLRASLAELTRRLTNYPPQGLGAVDSTPPAELRPPTHRGPGIRYRDAITALDAAAARRGGHCRRRGQHRSGGDPPSARPARRPVRGGARDGRHGLQLRRRHRHGVRPSVAAPSSWPATGRSSCTASNCTPPSNTGCQSRWCCSTTTPTPCA